MSTPALYSFTSHGETFHVYKHHDGYPEDAASHIAVAFVHAWPLPRFEADEFAAAFVASNKDGEGGVRLCHSGTWQKVASLDIEYRYEMTVATNGELLVTAWAVDCPDWDNRSLWRETELFSGTLAQFRIAAADLE